MTEQEWRYEFKFRLRKRMRKKRKDMTQKELAILSGVEEHTISRYMNMTRKPSAEAVYKLAKALDCTPNDLIYFDDNNLESREYMGYDDIC